MSEKTLKHVIANIEAYREGKALADVCDVHDAIALQDHGWKLAAMLRFLREHDGECLGDHPDWLAKIDGLLVP